MTNVLSGLDVLNTSPSLQGNYKGNVALLCHNASIDRNYRHATLQFKEIFGSRFVKIFGPQHGFNTDAQDNMIETDHEIHPYFNISIYSLYSETRIPTDEMLESIDHLFVDLQDIGCRMYTYIYTLTLLLEKCSDKNIEVVVLDRPNPINGIDLEGNILEPEFRSFIGRHPIPVRHGLTIGEVALMHQKFWADKRANLDVIKMQGWDRHMYFDETGLPWVSPSPNISRPETTCTFPAVVLFEGTTLSEGRGTNQALELFGHPSIEPYSFKKSLEEKITASKLEGFVLRPVSFLPTFDKLMGRVCGGLQLHITDRSLFKPWWTGQFLLREVYSYLKENFKWRKPPFEYNNTQLPIDIINGSNKPRLWVENYGSLEELNAFEELEAYKSKLDEIKLY